MFSFFFFLMIRPPPTSPLFPHPPLFRSPAALQLAEGQLPDVGAVDRAAVAVAQLGDVGPPLQRVALRPDDRPLAGEAERSEEHTSELQSRQYLVCRLLLEKKKKNQNMSI